VPFVRHRLVVTLIAALALVGPCSAATVSAEEQPQPTPTATPFDGISIVGPVFKHGLDAPHSCTASVLSSPARDLIITAAHCLSGTAAGIQFAPGYDKGLTPYGVWTVTSAYVDPAWLTTQDPRYDYAILRVADHGDVGIQDVTGGALLGTSPRRHQAITDVAYNGGIDDQPITCTPRTYKTEGYPSFDCHGYVGGSSGSPWLTTVRGTRVNVVHGVIGGLHQGGCFEYTSYSSPFGKAVFRLLARADAGTTADTLPVAGGDGC
jgi:V8-like Glu-specific endopeptidase